MCYSINKICDLPPIGEVLKTAKSLALADAIFMPEWAYRYFSFDHDWSKKNHEMMASMRDGEGGEYFFHFSKTGVVAKVFHEQELENTSSYLGKVPDCFSAFKNEKAFSLDHATFFCWREINETDWSVSPDRIDHFPLLGFLANGYEYYRCWSEKYYEIAIDEVVLRDVFKSHRVSPAQLAILNPELKFDDLAEELRTMRFEL